MIRWRPLGVPLYLRIWLAVVVAVAVLTVAFGWLWRSNAEQAPAREVVIRNDKDEILGQTRARPVRVPGQGAEFDVVMKDGSTLTVQISGRQRRPGEGPPPRPWAR
ncbi:MAG: two-component sensor histidine kinase, partial [Ramlibacter sp.]